MRATLKHYYWKYVDYVWCRLRHGLADKKHAREFRYWRKRWRDEGGTLRHGHYESIFLGMAGEKDQSFLENKVVADFGCGPRGSLCWATRAQERIGIDVLADAYLHLGANRHNMRYVRSTESVIPLGDGSVDVLCTLNALDHVHNLPVICAELMRILKPGGIFLGSFNLNEAPTVTEPQTLTTELLEQHLLSHLELSSRRQVPPGKNNSYEHFLSAMPTEPLAANDVQVLWVRGVKLGSL
jgi:SAM-dependent methyltransferase